MVLELKPIGSPLILWSTVPDPETALLPHLRQLSIEVLYFTDAKDSGFIYIEYTSPKPEYTSGSYGGPPDYEYKKTGGPFAPPGNFTVVMFHDLKAKTIKLCGPYKSSDLHDGIGVDGTPVQFVASEVGSLAAAKTKFTIDTEADFVAWSNVSPQTKVE
jgi:hypothetical protein